LKAFEIGFCIGGSHDSYIFCLDFFLFFLVIVLFCFMYYIYNT
jgi:hypothetical protein